MTHEEDRKTISDEEYTEKVDYIEYALRSLAMALKELDETAELDGNIPPWCTDEIEEAYGEIEKAYTRLDKVHREVT